jgi:hypothetical protein
MKTVCFFALFFIEIFSVTGQTGNKSGTFIKVEYNLSAPDIIYLLPHDLKEISGITQINDSTIACVQDERGIVFIYNFNKNQTSRQFIFGPQGDYEDIARVEETLYVVKSSELLTEIKDFKAGNIKTENYMLGIPGKDIEGLCYDKKNNRLLIAPKEISKDSDKKDNRFIYGFDLGSKKLIKAPAFEFELKSIKRFCMENNIKVPMKSKKDGKKDEPDIKFRPSAIGIHPVTNKLILISGMEHLIFVFDMNGNIEYLEKLDPALFPQPEGITFLTNGDMLISNEGRHGSATLLRFNFSPPPKEIPVKKTN